ncbi:ATPase, T2SS/T4P/T4SS family [Paracoccus litorisediminis]|uniref:ATPase, T2SS/T4P/T4SS family n=1 Tax=Paracoccus litorisediminis TaxID=2006130 RepID=UPI003733DF5B
MENGHQHSVASADLTSLGFSPREIADMARMRKRTSGLHVLSGRASSGTDVTMRTVLEEMIRDGKRAQDIHAIGMREAYELPGIHHVPCHRDPDGVTRIGKVVEKSLHEDPDIIAMTEIVTSEFAKSAADAASRGQAVWTTLHTGSALGILDRLADLGVPNWQLADPTIIRGLVHQRRLSKICRLCSITLRKGVENGRVDETLAMQFCSLLMASPNDIHVRGRGCGHCVMGRAGETLVTETVIPDSYLLELFNRGERNAMREYWLDASNGLQGLPILHHALMKAGAGICDISDIEAEIGLLSEYERNCRHLAINLRSHAAKLIEIPDRKG